jgi:hypothetical protein
MDMYGDGILLTLQLLYYRVEKLYVCVKRRLASFRQSTTPAVVKVMWFD